MIHRAIPDVAPPDRSLIEALLTPDAFPHPTATVEVLETHISWVLLTDDYAYKIKKPIDIGFLDFSTLERRRHFCEEELRLNRPWAPELYLDVQPIAEVDGRPCIGAPGTPVEYAVRMHRFDQGARLDHQLETGELTADDMHALGEAIAEQHRLAAQVPTDRRAQVLADTWQFIEDNFGFLAELAAPETLEALMAWSRAGFERLQPVLEQRFDGGFFRECHGDLHLGNLVRLPQGIRAFDCIEFDPALRNTDVYCDVAFLTMDFVARGRPDLAAGFLNRYLECSGDYEGMAVFDLFFVYRSLVRAKVAAIGSAEYEPGPARDHELEELERYCRLATAQTQKSPPLLLLMHGLSGSGKTWLSTRLLTQLPAIRLRSDLERRRLHGLSELADSASGVGTGIYADSSSAAVYARLRTLAALLLEDRHNVVLDAAFLSADERRRALALAEEAGIAAVIIHVDAPQSALRERLAARVAAATDASEADAEVLAHQLQQQDPLTAAERERTVVVDASLAADPQALIDRIRSVAGRL